MCQNAGLIETKIIVDGCIASDINDQVEIVFVRLLAPDPGSIGGLMRKPDKPGLSFTGISASFPTKSLAARGPVRFVAIRLRGTRATRTWRSKRVESAG